MAHRPTRSLKELWGQWYYQPAFERKRGWGRIARTLNARIFLRNFWEIFFLVLRIKQGTGIISVFACGFSFYAFLKLAA